MLKLVQDNKSKFLALGALAGAAVAGYIYLTKKYREDLLTPKFREELKKNAVVEKTSEGLYDVKTLIYVKTSVLNAGIVTFSTSLFMNRKTLERRNLAKNNKEYIAYVEEYITEMENLNVNLENEILSELNLDVNTYKKSSQHYLAEKNVEYLTKLSELTVVTRIEMQQKTPVIESEGELHKHLQGFVDLIQREDKNLAILRRECAKNPHMTQIVRKKIYDLIFNEYNIEEEDIMRAYVSCAANPDIKSAHEKFLSAINFECQGRLDSK